MSRAASCNWAELYLADIAGLASRAAVARICLAGFSACVDRLHRLAPCLPVLETSAEPRARSLAKALVARAASGIGGELVAYWPEGSDFLDAHLGGSARIGGTAAQAANVLAAAGAPVLLALADRSAPLLGCLDPRVSLAEGGALRPVAQIQPSGTGRPSHHIFEYDAGERIGSFVASRSTRVIVRFGDDGVERDGDFLALSEALAGEAGSAIVSGFNGSAPEDLPADLEMIARAAAGWRARGLGVVHLELCDFNDPRQIALGLPAMAGKITSVGMSLAELVALAPAEVGLAGKLVAVAGRVGASRAVVHADDWAFSISRLDPDLEAVALRHGCLLASARAAAGDVAVPSFLPEGARFGEPPAASPERRDGWHETAVSSPHLVNPAGTIGLGDTFVAGMLLVLGGARAPAFTVPEPKEPGRAGHAT